MVTAVLGGTYGRFRLPGCTKNNADSDDFLQNNLKLKINVVLFAEGRTPE